MIDRSFIDSLEIVRSPQTIEAEPSQNSEAERRTKTPLQREEKLGELRLRTYTRNRLGHRNSTRNPGNLPHAYHGIAQLRGVVYCHLQPLLSNSYTTWEPLRAKLKKIRKEYFLVVKLERGGYLLLPKF